MTCACRIPVLNCHILLMEVMQQRYNNVRIHTTADCSINQIVHLLVNSLSMSTKQLAATWILVLAALGSLGEANSKLY
jgi:hypothetical protein